MLIEGSISVRIAHRDGKHFGEREPALPFSLLESHAWRDLFQGMSQCRMMREERGGGGKRKGIKSVKVPSATAQESVREMERGGRGRRH